MNVLLLILKIIGIVLLSILGLIVLIVNLVLFVPFIYKVNVLIPEVKKDTCGKVSCSWLLSLLHVSFNYNNNKGQIVLRIFGIPIKRINVLGEDEDKKSQNKNEEKKKARNSRKKQVAQAKIESHVKNNDDSLPPISELSDPNSGLFTIEAEDNSDVSLDSNELNDDIDNGLIDEIASTKEDDSNNYTYSCEADSHDDNKELISKKDSVFDRLLLLFHKIVETIKKIFDLIVGLFTKTEETINKISKEYDFYSRFFSDDRNKQILSKLVKTLKRLINSIKPHKVKGKIHIGFEDPATTGQMLAIISLVYPVLPRKLIIDPEFDTKVLEGYVNLKGRIFVVVLIWAALRIYFDKNFKRMSRIYKKHKNKQISK